MSLELDHRALDKAVDLLHDLHRRGGDLRPFLAEVADDMRTQNRDHYRRARWAPVTPEYAARKAREGRGHTPGVYTGQLLASLTQTGARFHGERIGSDYVEVVTRNPVAHLYDKGTKRQRGRDLNPRRKLEARAQTWRAMLTRYLLDGEARL